MAIESLPDSQLAEIRPLLIELLHGEQEPIGARGLSRVELEAWLPRTRPSFAGRNRIFVSRDEEGMVEGFCWCVLFDPGTGLEGEVAELYVAPRARGRGLARALVAEAVELFTAERVTFGCVWTEAGNRAAVSAYRGAGFRPTRQLVMTWYPEP